MKHLRLGIDLDGVLANFTRAFGEEANAMFPGRGIPTEDHEITSWNHNVDKFLLSREEQSQVWEKIKHTENFWYHEPPYRENVAALQDFMTVNPNAYIYFITSRVPSEVGLNVLAQTNMWLSDRYLRSHRTAVLPVLHANPNGGLPPKLQVIEALGIEAMVDDYLPTIESLGSKGWLLKRPWNREAGPGIQVVDTLKEFLDKFSEGGEKV